MMAEAEGESKQKVMEETPKETQKETPSRTTWGYLKEQYGHVMPWCLQSQTMERPEIMSKVEKAQEIMEALESTWAPFDLQTDAELDPENDVVKSLCVKMDALSTLLSDLAMKDVRRAERRLMNESFYPTSEKHQQEKKQLVDRDATNDMISDRWVGKRYVLFDVFVSKESRGFGGSFVKKADCVQVEVPVCFEGKRETIVRTCNNRLYETERYITPHLAQFMEEKNKEKEEEKDAPWKIGRDMEVNRVLFLDRLDKPSDKKLCLKAIPIPIPLPHYAEERAKERTKDKERKRKRKSCAEDVAQEGEGEEGAKKCKKGKK